MKIENCCIHDIVELATSLGWGYTLHERNGWQMDWWFKIRNDSTVITFNGSAYYTTDVNFDVGEYDRYDDNDEYEY